MLLSLGHLRILQNTFIGSSDNWFESYMEDGSFYIIRWKIKQTKHAMMQIVNRHTRTCEKWSATIGIQARPIKTMQKPRSKPSDGGLPFHHCRASNIVSRQNQTEIATTKA